MISISDSAQEVRSTTDDTTRSDPVPSSDPPRDLSATPNQQVRADRPASVQPGLSDQDIEMLLSMINSSEPTADQTNDMAPAQALDAVDQGTVAATPSFNREEASATTSDTTQPGPKPSHHSETDPLRALATMPFRQVKADSCSLDQATLESLLLRCRILIDQHER